MVNDHIGKICPFCKTKLTADDEIVICSQCEMPHHKDCWVENQGCTTFGCQGTIEGVDNHEVSESVIYCTKCGQKSSTAASFCTRCGNKLQTNVVDILWQPQNDSAGGVRFL